MGIGYSEKHNASINNKKRLRIKGKVNIYVHQPDGETVGVLELFDGYQIGGGVDTDGAFLNTSLNTAKEVFSKALMGDNRYKIAKIAFGNAGHSIDNHRAAIPATPEDTTLNSLIAIKDSLKNTDKNTWFLRDENGINHRMVYIEKDILPEHVSFGEEGNQIVIRVPISFNDYNKHQGTDPNDELQPFVSDLIRYDFIDEDGNVIKVGDVDPDTGDAADGYDFTEVKVSDDGNGNTVYRFRNGYAPDGTIDTDNGGSRPQELSEILLTTDIIDDNGEKKKISIARITSGLLSFPMDFTFTYEWILEWDFVEESN